MGRNIRNDVHEGDSKGRLGKPVSFLVYLLAEAFLVTIHIGLDAPRHDLCQHRHSVLQEGANI